MFKSNLQTRVERNPRSHKKGNQKLRNELVPNKANDPLALHNKFGAFEDMDFAPSPSSTRVHSHSPIKREDMRDPYVQYYGDLSIYCIS